MNMWPFNNNKPTWHKIESGDKLSIGDKVFCIANPIIKGHISKIRKVKDKPWMSYYEGNAVTLAEDPKTEYWSRYLKLC